MNKIAHLYLIWDIIEFTIFIFGVVRLYQTVIDSRKRAADVHNEQFIYSSICLTCIQHASQRDQCLE